jgi:hypothetical protein
MKAKKEKNRCEDQSEHSTLLPSSNSAKSLNNSLSSLNGIGGANNAGNLMGNVNMITGQHLTSEEASFLGLTDNEDGKHQLKMSGLSNGLMPNSTTTSPMWSTAQSVHAATAGAMFNPDQINAWPILPQSTHSQSNQYMSTPYLPYGICQPNNI